MMNKNCLQSDEFLSLIQNRHSRRQSLDVFKRFNRAEATITDQIQATENVDGVTEEEPVVLNNERLESGEEQSMQEIAEPIVYIEKGEKDVKHTQVCDTLDLEELPCGLTKVVSADVSADFKITLDEQDRLDNIIEENKIDTDNVCDEYDEDIPIIVENYERTIFSNICGNDDERFSLTKCIENDINVKLLKDCNEKFNDKNKNKDITTKIEERQIGEMQVLNENYENTAFHRHSKYSCKYVPPKKSKRKSKRRPIRYSGGYDPENIPNCECNRRFITKIFPFDIHKEKDCPIIQARYNDSEIEEESDKDQARINSKNKNNSINVTELLRKLGHPEGSNDGLRKYVVPDENGNYSVSVSELFDIIIKLRDEAKKKEKEEAKTGWFCGLFKGWC
ncbi:hypothetical protein COBT_002922 [Conglomerata obtusa]